jgi:type IV secretory pathway VirB10-like protein
MVGKSGHKGISRIDSETNKTHGWYVRVQFQGKTHAKFFSDSAHGGDAKALAKAVKHRNAVERELGKPRTDRMVTAVSSRNTSGVQGVKRVFKAGSYAYEVTWSPAAGQVHRTTVSVNRYGEDEAFKRACQIRQQKERAYYGGLMLREIPPTPPIPPDQMTQAALAAQIGERPPRGRRPASAAEPAKTAAKSQSKNREPASTTTVTKAAAKSAAPAAAKNKKDKKPKKSKSK